MNTRKTGYQPVNESSKEQKQVIRTLIEDCKNTDILVSGKAISKLFTIGLNEDIPLSSGILSALLALLTNWDAPSIHLADMFIFPAAEMNTITISAFTFLHHPLANSTNDKYGNQIIKAWPKVHLWVIYYYYTKIVNWEPMDELEGKVPLQPAFLAGAMSSLLQPYEARKVISASPMIVEMLTDMWLTEKQDPSDFFSPYATNALELTLRVLRTDEEHIEFIDRIVKAAGVSVDEIVQKLMERTKEELKANPHRSGVMANMLLIYRLCGPSQHGFRLAFLNAGTVPLFTDIIRIMAQTLKTGDYPEYEANMVATMRTAFAYLGEQLESVNGFAWVTQAIEAGFIKAFILATAFFHRFSYEEKLIAFIPIKEVLPKYLVYRSFIQVVHHALKEMRHHHVENFIVGRDAIAALSAFQKLALERTCCLNILQMEKKYSSFCDNPKCRKDNEANNFRKCSGCRVSVYCSVACQSEDWKSGEHKEFCQQVQKEIQEGLPHTVSRSDSAFFHHLAIRDARRNRPKLKRMAQEDFPAIPLEELTVLADYTVYPVQFSLQHNPENNISTEGDPNEENVDISQDVDAATQTRPGSPSAAPADLVAISTPKRTSRKKSNKKSPKSPKTQRIIGSKQPQNILDPIHKAGATQRRLIIQSQIPNGADHIHYVTTTFTGGFWDEMNGVPRNLHITQIRSQTKKGFRALRQNKATWDHSDAEVLDLVKEMGNDPDYIYDEVDLLMNAAPLKKGVRETKIRTASGRELLFRTQAVEIGKFRRSGLPMPDNLLKG